MLNVPSWFWAVFVVGVVGVLALDLGVLHRKAHVVKTKEALAWSCFWIGSALLFNVWVYFQWGKYAALEFLTAYLIEKSLSLDNIFVFIVIFSSFSVAIKYQHRVLFWGILGALVMRGMIIFLGANLVHHFHWITYIFGGFLVYTAYRMATHHIPGEDVTTNPLITRMRKMLPVAKTFHGQQFFAKEQGQFVVTPLFLVLIMIEITDLLFAVDSIPAILAISLDPFIIFTSNIFAILGLRSLYFFLANTVPKFYYLQHGLSAILGFVGIKMLLADIYAISIPVSLAVIAGILIAAIIASIYRVETHQHLD